MPSLTKIHSFDEVFDSQRLFRQILTVMANPARKVNIKEFADRLHGDNPGMLAVAMTLLDNEVGFCAVGNADLAEEISFLTFAKREEAETADYIFVTDAAFLGDAVKKAKCGTLRDPHKSATIIVRTEGADAGELSLRGPGIKDTVSLGAPQAVISAIEMRDAQNYEYPQGVDFIFISDSGELFSIPRLVRKEAF